MHRAPAGPAHQDRAYEFVECPMKAARNGQSDIDPTNMVPTPGVCLCLLQLTHLLFTCGL